MENVELRGVLNKHGRLVGTLSSPSALKGTLQSPKTLHATLTVGNIVIEDKTLPYEGTYTVSPKPEVTQTLETEGLRMLDDVTVYPIPVFETSNEYGTTFIIGDD